MKQAAEFGLTRKQKLVGLILGINGLPALTLKAAQGAQIMNPFYWDLNDGTRSFAKRFAERHPQKNYPNDMQAGVYASVIHYLKAVDKAGGATDGKAVVAAMKAMPTDDPLFGKGFIRADGRKIHPLYLLEVKKPDEVAVEMGPPESGRHRQRRGCVPADEGWRLRAGEIVLVRASSTAIRRRLPYAKRRHRPARLELRFLDAGVSVERRPDASMVLRTDVPFEPSDALIHGYLRRWALARPQQKFLAERSADGDELADHQLRRGLNAASRLATSFAARGLGERRPILILSGNSIAHQLVAWPPDGRPSLHAAFGGLFDHERRSRQAPRHPRRARSRTGVCRRRRALRAGARDRGDARPRLVLGRGHENVSGAISLASLFATAIDDAVLDVRQNCRRRPSRKFSSPRDRPVRPRACRPRTG